MFNFCMCDNGIQSCKNVLLNLVPFYKDEKYLLHEIEIAAIETAKMVHAFP